MSHFTNWLKVALRPVSRYAPVFEVYRGKPLNGQEWYFRERAANGQITGGGMEPFDSKYNAKRAAYVKAARTDGATVLVLDGFHG